MVLDELPKGYAQPSVEKQETAQCYLTNGNAWGRA